MIDVLADVCTTAVIKTSAGVLELTDVVVDAVIALEFIVPTGIVIDIWIDALVGMLAGVITGVLPSTGVDILADVDVNVLGAVMTALDFTLPVSLEE